MVTMREVASLAGVSITNGNVVDETQVRELTAALTQPPGTLFGRFPLRSLIPVIHPAAGHAASSAAPEGWGRGHQPGPTCREPHHRFQEISP